MKFMRPLIIAIGLIVVWQAVVLLTEVPFFHSSIANACCGGND